MTGYTVNEVFYTLQGEGAWTGRPAVFCRFAKCNLWSGLEADRATAVCTFCDTDFLTGARTVATAAELADEIERAWPDPQRRSVLEPGERMVVLTGGEPTLQVDQALLAALHARRFYVAVETNGTRHLPAWLTSPHAYDWVCVSPKAGAVLRVTEANEIKVVYPQHGIDLDALADFPATHHWISPMDGPNLNENTPAAIEYVKRHPEWRLNTQTHKTIGIS